ncbi:MAG: hypothetical protein AAGB19_18910, partial [Cyanobacteria bacterium P01_F01_bin.3]
MGNTSGHIEQQLAKLQTQTTSIATELEALVDSYLDILSQASKRQLMLAAYHVCTQIYPERFLDLSVSQRDHLQKRLRELGSGIHAQLKKKWETAKRLSLKPSEDDGLAVIRQLFLEAAAIREKASNKPTDENEDELPSTPPAPTATTGEPRQKLIAELRTLINEDADEVSEIDGETADTEPPEEHGPMQPAQLMRRQILIEKAIRDVLKDVSEKANTILQTAQIMPEMPKSLLSAASDSERFGHVPMKTPNLVRLAIKILHEPDKSDFDESEASDSEAETTEQWDEPDITAAIIARDRGDVDPEDEDDTEEPNGMPRLLQLD